MTRWTRRGCILALAAALVVGGCSGDENDGANSGETNNGGADAGGDTGPGIVDDAGADAGGPGDDAGPGEDTGAGEDAGADAGGDTGPIDLGDPTIGSWSPDYTARGMGASLGGRVNDLEMAPDGTIYAGGIFETAGGVSAIGVAAWDGSDWSQLGEGIDAKIDALALSNDGTTLYAGGQPNSGGGGGIGIPGGGGGAKIWTWDGVAWSALASVGGDFPRIGALEVLASGDLVVGGWFGDVDGTPIEHLAIYDGVGWQPASAQPFDGGVWAIEERLDDYCVGGDFANIGTTRVDYVACWKSGSGWSPLGDGLPGSVSTLLDMGDGTMLAGGTLTYMLDPVTLDYAIGLARYDGASWSHHAGGVDGGFVNDVKALEHGPGGSVLVGGTFNMVGKDVQNLAARNVASLDPTTWTWSRLGTTGVTNSVGVVLGTEPGVNDFLSFGDTVIAGGLFSKADDVSAHNIAWYDWQARIWGPLVDTSKTYAGLDGTVNALEVGPGGEIYATGYFPHAGGEPVNHVARLGAQGWEAMGGGLNDVGFALHHDGQDLYVGGSFANLPGTGATFIARWSGSAWVAVGGSVDGPIFDIVSDGQGKLYIGGDFESAGGQPANRIAVWDGATWSALGDGLGGRVTSIALGDDGTVYAAGVFSTLGDETTPARAVAAWNGSTWAEVGGGVFSGDYAGYVSELVRYDGKIFVAGHFDTAARGTANEVVLNSVGLWNGTSWETMGEGIEPQYAGLAATMSAATTLGADGLVVSGTFQEMGGEVYDHLAYWDGNAWLPLGGGISDLAEDVVVIGRSLYIGGSFTAAGGRPSYGIAVWSW